MNNDEIRNLFKIVKEATTKPEEADALCEKYLSSSTPTYNLSILKATVDPLNLANSLRDRSTGFPIIMQLRTGLTALLHERGYRNNIETHQEHLLIGSSGSGLNSNAKQFPYTVGAILNGDISIDETRRARSLEYMSSGALGNH